MRPMSSLNRAVGAAAGSTLALALLVAGCVFAAMAGPALSLHARSAALHQTADNLAPTVKAVQVSANWTNFVDALVNFSGANQNVPVADQNLTATQLARAAREIKAQPGRPAAPTGPGDWYGLSAEPALVASGAAPSAVLDGKPPKLEVLYRDVLASNAELVAGQLLGSGRAGRDRSGGGQHGDRGAVRAAPGEPGDTDQPDRHDHAGRHRDRRGSGSPAPPSGPRTRWPASPRWSPRPGPSRTGRAGSSPTPASWPRCRPRSAAPAWS